MDTEILYVILSSITVVSSIVAAIFSVLTNRKKEYIDNITKERKQWREKLRKIAEEITGAENKKQFQIAIEKLKVRVNPYGQSTSLFFDDSYIWELIDGFKSENEEDEAQFDEKKLDKKKSELVSLISCVLKHDWERVKDEIKGSVQTRILALADAISFLLFSTYYFLNAFPTLSNYLNYCVIMIGFTFVCMLVISHADKWKKVGMLIFTMGWGIVIMFVFTVLFHCCVQNINTLKPIGILIIFIPFLGGIYCFAIKAIKYRNDMGRFIATISTITNRKIPPRFKIFVKNKIFHNINSGRFEKYPLQKSFYKQDFLCVNSPTRNKYVYLKDKR